MNGVEVAGQRRLGFAAEADAVLIGSGVGTRDAVADESLLGSLPLDPARQVRMKPVPCGPVAVMPRSSGACDTSCDE
jgi:hypothetical protein